MDASGEIIWVHDHAVLVRDADGNRLHWQGMVIDVTARVAAERAARAAQHRFTTIEGQLPIIVYAVDDALAPGTLYCSPSAQEVIGVSADAFLAGTSVFPDYLHPDDREAARRGLGAGVARAGSVPRRVPGPAARTDRSCGSATPRSASGSRGPTGVLAGRDARRHRASGSRARSSRRRRRAGAR